jgi:DNA-directed RNA polymerase alpha subunit
MSENDQTVRMKVLEELEVSPATSAELQRAGLGNIAQLINKSESELTKLNFSKTAILEIKQALGEMGLALSPD